LGTLGDALKRIKKIHFFLGNNKANTWDVSTNKHILYMARYN